MQNITRQLERVRSTARLMLFARVLTLCIFVASAAVLALSLIDYALRLPAWLRGVLLVTLLAAGGWRLFRRLWETNAFRPELSTLAMRAEAMYPHLSGWLATGVEFAGVEDGSPATQRLMHASMRETEQRVASISLRRLLEPAPVMRSTAAGLLGAVAIAAAVLVFPQQAALAAQRWLTPWSAPAWPMRTQIEAVGQVDAWPADMPMNLRARVDRGYQSGMRTWVHVRVVDIDGQPQPWRSLLMGAASDDVSARPGRFERLVDVPSLIAGANLTGSEAARRRDIWGSLDVAFEAGDHRTESQRITLVTRPTLRSLRVTAEPPAYAAGLAEPQELWLQETGLVGGQIASASTLQGSNVTLELGLSKPLPANLVTLDALLPGFADVDAALDVSRLAEDPPIVGVRFVLRDTVETTVRLVDGYGFENLSERVYRIEAQLDQLPLVSLLHPAGDESVLPTARLPVEASAQDDIGVEWLRIQAEKGAAPGADASADKPVPLTIDGVTGRQARLQAASHLDVTRLDVEPGDTIYVFAKALDIYDMDGRRHRPVTSTSRRLRVIDAAQFMAQIYTELAGVRQQSTRLRDDQRALQKQSATDARSGQELQTRRLETQKRLLDRLVERVDRNRLDRQTAAGMDDLVRQVAELIGQAESASRTATDALEQVEKAPLQSEAANDLARESQASVEQTLTDLVDTLDQSRDVMTIRLQLQQLRSDAEAKLKLTQQMLTQTLGRDRDDLTDAERDRLDDLRNGQDTLADQADDLVRQMLRVAQSLDQPDANPDELSASQALSDAAQVSQQLGLSNQMREAGKQIADSQLSDATSQQQQSLETLAQMLERMGQQDDLRRAILKRKVTELAEAVANLVRMQKAELERLGAAEQLPALAQPMALLNRNTTALEVDVRALKEFDDVATELTAAGVRQADAVLALRRSIREEAHTGENESLAALQRARELLEKQQDKGEKNEEDRRCDELRGIYEDLARRQKQLREQVAPLAEAMADGQRLARQDRAGLVGLGDVQGELADDAEVVSKQVQDTIMFVHMHRRIHSLAEGAADRLRLAAPDALLLADQQDVEDLFLTMAKALAQAQNEKDSFASGQDDNGGGDGAAGGNQPTPIVPPLAELKLLQGLQQNLREQASDLDRKVDASPVERRRTILRMATLQEEMADLSEQLVRSAIEQQGGAMPLPINQPDADDAGDVDDAGEPPVQDQSVPVDERLEGVAP